jgi:hypothetical protein
MDPEIEGRSLLSGRRTRQVRGYISSKSLSSISVPESIMTVIVMCVLYRAVERGPTRESVIFLHCRMGLSHRLGIMYGHDESRIGSQS